MYVEYENGLTFLLVSPFFLRLSSLVLHSSVNIEKNIILIYIKIRVHT